MDKHPSLKVYGRDKGWYCFQCHKGGGAVEFYAYHQKITVGEAKKRLAKIFKISDTTPELPAYEKPIPNYGRVIRDWERVICAKVHRHIQSVEDGPVRNLLYGAWTSFGWELLDRAEIVAASAKSYKFLDDAREEIVEFFLFVLDLYIDEVEISENIAT